MVALPFTKFLCCFFLFLQLIHSIKHMEHIKVNKDGSASFSVEMDLKSASSNVYLLKVGEEK